MRLLELFSGTGSVGSVFREHGWEVVSLDWNPRFCPTIVADIRLWEYKAYPPNYFDVIWASPDCTQYSRARTSARTPRDFFHADSLVRAALAIIDYFGCPYFLENPQTGLLKERSFMEGRPFQDVTYCSYGYKYQKKTRIWTNTSWIPRPLCDRRTCPFVVGGRHIQTAQRGPGKDGAQRRKGDRNELTELYSIPRALVEEIFQHCLVLLH